MYAFEHTHVYTHAHICTQTAYIQMPRTLTLSYILECKNDIMRDCVKTSLLFENQAG